MQGWHTTSDRQAGIRQPAVALSPTQIERTRHAPKSQPPLLHTEWGLFSSVCSERSPRTKRIVGVVDDIEQLRRRWREKLTYHFAYAR